jgi:hypothetical protein
MNRVGLLWLHHWKVLWMAALKGEDNTWNYHPKKTRHYDGFSVQYCGSIHSVRRNWIGLRFRHVRNDSLSSGIQVSK